MEKKTFQEYAKIKHQIKELTETAKEMEAEIVEGMVKEGAEKVKTEFGGFTLKTYVSIELTDAQKAHIETLEGAIEALPEVVALKGKIGEVEAQGKKVERKGIMFK